MIGYHKTKRFAESLMSCVVLCLLVPTTAMAIERHFAETLPDDLYHSAARGFTQVFDDAGTDIDLHVVGAITQADGSNVAAFWERDGQAWTATKLPTPDGFDSMANAVAFAPLKPAEYVVGIIGILIGNVWTDMRPAIWVRGESGDWKLDDVSIPAARGRLNAITEGPSGNVIMVGTAQSPTGNSRGIIAVELDAGFQVDNLGTLGGANSEAEDAVVDPDQNIIVLGRAQLPDGKWRAALWQQGGVGEWQARDMGALRNRQSLITTAIHGHHDGLLAVGSSFISDGRSRAAAFYLDVNGDSYVSPLDALLAYRNSSATGGLWFSGSPGGGDAPAHYRILESVWDDTDIVHVIDAAVVNGPYGVHLLSDIIEDTNWVPGEQIGITPDGTIIGNGLFGGAGNDMLQAAVMWRSDVHMPDAMHVRHGRAMRSSRLEDSWWADGEQLRIAAGRTRRGRVVDVVFEYQMPFMSSEPFGLEIELTATYGGAKKHSASGEQNVQLFDHELQMWKTVWTGPVTKEPSTTTISVPADAGGWNYLSTAMTRITVTSFRSNRRWGYAIDEIVVTPTP